MLKQILKPNGEYNIGISKLDITDNFRNRLIPLQIYFPLSKGEHVPFDKLYETRSGNKFPQLETQVFAKPCDISEMSEYYPLVIFNHGNNGLMTDYAIILEEIVSHGFIVITIQHQLGLDKELPEYHSGRSISKHANVIDNILCVFDWLKNHNILSKHFDTSKICLIGHSMGGNALLMLMSRISGQFREGGDAMLSNSTYVKECVIFLDGEYEVPTSSNIPILFCLSEERKHYHEQSGVLKLLNKLGYKYIHYPGSKHISFMDHAYVHADNNLYFSGDFDKRTEFYINLRRNTLDFIHKHLEINYEKAK